MGTASMHSGTLLCVVRLQVSRRQGGGAMVLHSKTRRDSDV